MRNVILTGIPRSGTTLTAALIDSLPDTICLSEPGWHEWPLLSQSGNYAKWLAGDFIKLRKKILDGEPVSDRRAFDGKAITNYYRLNPESQKIERNYTILNVRRPGLSKNFTLAVKHNGPYLSALPAIVDMGWFTVIAIVRNPLDVLHSWRSLSLQVSHGRMPDATPGWPQMAELVARPMELLEKQVRMYDLICQRLYSLRDHIRVIHYETLLANPDVLSEAVGMKTHIDRKLIKSSVRPIPEENRRAILHAVKSYGRHYAHFYNADLP